MAIDVDTYDTPGWWLKRLQTKLELRRQRIDPLYARYSGDTPLPESLLDAPETAVKFYRTARTNFAEMLIKTVGYKTKVSCIQTPRDSGETGDAEAWAAWRRAGMLVEGPDIVRNMLVAGDGYAIVAKDEDGPAATSEDPRQVVTIHDPVRQSRIRAAGKFFADDDEGRAYAYLYRDGRVWVAVKVGRAGRAPRVRFSQAWDWDTTQGGADGEAIPDGGMPVVRYRNDEGVGDFERHTDLLDRVDHLVLQAMVVATLQAFKQRAIKVSPADMPDKDPDTGELIDYAEMFVASPDALWKLPETAEMWESGAVDVGPINTMVKDQLIHVSAVTFTPLSAFSPEGANQSAQGASLVREGSTFKVEDKQARVGAAHAMVAAKVFALSGDEELAKLTDPHQITIGWAPAERFSLSERADAAVKAKAAGVPWRTIMREIMQFSPEQVQRMESERMSDAVLFPAEAAQTTAADVAPAPVADVAPTTGG